mmetsp:Transcript_142135/g.247710  ORF Transcript_142135/g.247710 Transcript_142135/m.247710 type:complete len:253 (+) Transcript_142135:57-815(+)
MPDASHAAAVQRGLGGMGAHPPPLLQPDMPLSGHVLTFMLTCATDCALIPPMIVMKRYRRHFEIYVGCVMLVSAFAYNFLDAMNHESAAEKAWDLFITEDAWHRIVNVASTTYICMLFIHLACVEDAVANIILRYSFASAVVLAQVKDEFWMQKTQYTIYVVVFCFSMLVARYVYVAQLPVYWNSVNLARGILFGICAGVCFYFGLDDVDDEFRFAHGMGHLFGGLALTFLWKMVPRPKKKDDNYLERRAYV